MAIIKNDNFDAYGNIVPDCEAGYESMETLLEELENSSTKSLENRIKDIEKSLDYIRGEVEHMMVAPYLELQANDYKRTSPVLQALEKTNPHYTWKQRLILDENISADEVYRGDVEGCFKKIVTEIDFDLYLKQYTLSDTYFGATSDLHSRFKSHLKKFPELSLPPAAKTSPAKGAMKVLFGSSKMEKAAEMESMLIRHYKGSRNVSRLSNGLVFGKPNYFVYMLKFARRF